MTAKWWTDEDLVEKKTSFYETTWKPNDVIHHTTYHLKLATLDSPSYTLNGNKDKFMLGNVIVCYLKLLGTLQVWTQTDQTDQTDEHGRNCLVLIGTWRRWQRQC